MIPHAYDTETCLIRPALLAPPMVCTTWQCPGEDSQIVHVNDAYPVIRSWLEDPNRLLIGHFLAYDMTVVCAQFPDLVPLVFAAYKANRCICTKIRQQLLDIAGGVFRGRVGDKGRWITHKYDLGDLSKRHLGKPLIKDGWRLEYAHFLDVPLSRWPERARERQAISRARRAELPALPGKDKALAAEIANLDAIINDVPEGVIRYPLLDAETTLGVYQSQEIHSSYLKDEHRQAYAQFALYLSSTWGLRTHAPGVEALRLELQQAYEELAGEFEALGYVRPDGTRDMKAIKKLMVETCREQGIAIRRTDGHAKEGAKCGHADDCEEHVSLDSDACEAVALVDPTCTIADYSELSALKKMLTSDVPMLQAGTVYPVHTRFDIAETGRTTSSKPNIQNLNTGRGKKAATSVAQRLRPNIRQAFIPRPGHVFMQADFPQLELYTLAQCCYTWLGFSKLGDALNAGMDPHLAVAAQIVGVTYEEAAANKKRKDIDHARQVAKVFNFGKPGGLGAKKLVLFARKTYGVVLTVEQVEQYTNQWHAAFPEMRQYFARVNAMFGDDIERVSIESLFTERWRGGTTYCGACNNGFQGLGADCAKAAVCLIAEAQYSIETSPLYGSRTPAFVHDEFIGEVLDNPKAHDAAMELGRLMMVGANQFLPDVPIKKMEPVLMRRWDKNAEQVFVNGRLIPWGDPVG